jgi:hypothetical protein
MHDVVVSEIAEPPEDLIGVKRDSLFSDGSLLNEGGESGRVVGSYEMKQGSIFVCLEVVILEF